MKKIIFALSTLALLSCSKESVAPLNDETSASIEETTQTRRYEPTARVPKESMPVTKGLMAGQYMNVGDVTIDNDVNGDLVVTYNIAENTEGGYDWIITDSHLFVGTCGEQPVNGAGNPKIGHFPYKEVHAPGVVSFFYDVENMSDGCVAAHAVVVNNVDGSEETAWAAGVPYSTNADSWATIFGFLL